MKRLAIGFITGTQLPLKAVQNTLKHFPDAYLYVINPSYDVLNSINSSIVSQANHLGVDKYKILTKLCYFDDLRRECECEAVIDCSGNVAKIAKGDADPKLNDIIEELK